MYHDRRQHLHIAAQLCGGLGDEIDQATPALDPELKIYLMKLALSWTQAAGETVERELRASSGLSHLKLVAIERCLPRRRLKPGSVVRLRTANFQVRHDRRPAHRRCSRADEVARPR